MQNLNAKQIKEYTFFLARKEYEVFLEWRSGEGFKIAKQCDIDNTNETVWFIQRLLSKCFPFEDNQIGLEIKALAEKAEHNGDFWLILFIVSQIDQFENRAEMHEIKEWAANKLKELT